MVAAPEPVISMLKALAVVRRANEEGLPGEWLRQATGLELAARPALDDYIGVGQYFAVWEAVMHRLQEPGFPLRVAGTALDDYHLFSFIIATSATVGDALKRALSYQRLLMSTGRFRLDASAQQVILHWLPWSDAPGDAWASA